MPLPFAVSFAVTMDLALNAGAAVWGPEHFTLVASPVGRFGALVTAGIVAHDIQTAVVRVAKAAALWWRRRQERRGRRTPTPTLPRLRGRENEEPSRLRGREDAGEG